MAGYGARDNSGTVPPAREDYQTPLNFREKAFHGLLTRKRACLSLGRPMGKPRFASASPSVCESMVGSRRIVRRQTISTVC
jgi:hypothetical protein